MQRILVNQTSIAQTRTENVESAPLEAGQVRLGVESYALTSNNITYAAAGFDIGYWHFFPSGTEGWGIVPVWGTAKVIESRSDQLEVGTRLYGFYPMAEELVITPAFAPGGFIDAAEHRAKLPLIYNQYTPTRSGNDDDDHLRAILQPLLATSFLIFDWLQDNAFFGADQIVIGSASSKTGLGLCKYLAEPADRAYQIVGLTSEKNRTFVEGLGACDSVLTYDQIDDIAQIPSVYVDMSGNTEVKMALHDHLGDQLKHSSAVGLSHWDHFAPAQKLSGPKPEFFFAPSQVAKRRAEWGPGEIEKQITAAWKRIAADASNWMDVKVYNGVAASEGPYHALVTGQADPKVSVVIRP
ncbi:Protein of unknown function [Sulfitobacter marinus]|uniref:DUF2855 domain-containing protein n=1 Tax=Sulfitobacter marinus TaxID=394264 RepID=A0A1I6QWD6_9RHOB|nr:DUF2855 family protein [Sulfitobacter marinus]SFS56724.1 Protein of unknown function [Sulfitobacter marinus]